MSDTCMLCLRTFGYKIWNEARSFSTNFDGIKEISAKNWCDECYESQPKPVCEIGSCASDADTVVLNSDQKEFWACKECATKPSSGFTIKPGYGYD